MSVIMQAVELPYCLEMLACLGEFLQRASPLLTKSVSSHECLKALQNAVINLYFLFCMITTLWYFSLLVSTNYLNFWLEIKYWTGSKGVSWQCQFGISSSNREFFFILLSMKDTILFSPFWPVLLFSVFIRLPFHSHVIYRIQWWQWLTGSVPLFVPFHFEAYTCTCKYTFATPPCWTVVGITCMTKYVSDLLSSLYIYFDGIRGNRSTWYLLILLVYFCWFLYPFFLLFIRC